MASTPIVRRPGERYLTVPSPSTSSVMTLSGPRGLGQQLPGTPCLKVRKYSGLLPIKPTPKPKRTPCADANIWPIKPTPSPRRTPCADAGVWPIKPTPSPRPTPHARIFTRNSPIRARACLFPPSSKNKGLSIRGNGNKASAASAVLAAPRVLHSDYQKRRYRTASLGDGDGIQAPRSFSSKIPVRITRTRNVMQTAAVRGPVGSR